MRADGSGKMTTGEVPGEFADDVEAARETLIEDIAEADDTLMERYLEGEELGPDDLAKGLAKGVRERLFLPVAAAAALKNMGVQPVMELINRLMPSPIDRGAVAGVNPKDGSETSSEPDPAAPFAGLVFKTVADPFAGRLSMVRVFSGTLTSDMQLFNPNRDAKERFGQLYQQTGKTQKSLSEALPGDIVAIPKLKETHTGNTLCTVGNPIQFEDIEPPAGGYHLRHRSQGKRRRRESLRGYQQTFGRRPHSAPGPRPPDQRGPAFGHGLGAHRDHLGPPEA